MFTDFPQLYRLPPGTCGFFGLFGGTPDYEGAGEEQSRAALQAAQRMEQAIKTATGYIQPWQKTGLTAEEQLAGLYGLPGYTALDPTAQLLKTPGYQFLLDQGADALSRYGAASGLSLSGPAARGATNYGQNLAQTYAWGPYMSGLTGMSGRGLVAGGRMGDWEMKGGELVGEDYMAAAQARAQASIAQANAQAQQQGGIFSDILGGLGFVAGLFMGSPGLGSAVGRGLGNIFSGIGGGGGGFNPAMAGGGLGPVAGLPYYAEGGYTPGSSPIVVGERGPEVFVPERSGTVVPNHLIDYSVGIDFNNMFM